MLNGPACHRQKFFGAPRSMNDKLKPAIRCRSWQRSDRVACLLWVESGKPHSEHELSASRPMATELLPRCNGFVFQASLTSFRPFTTRRRIGAGGKSGGGGPRRSAPAGICRRRASAPVRLKVSSLPSRRSRASTVFACILWLTTLRESTIKGARSKNTRRTPFRYGRPTSRDRPTSTRSSAWRCAAPRQGGAVDDAWRRSWPFCRPH